jgi:tRNA pseudouridine38-40 synthase
MPRYKLTIEYDGTRYSGWQIQRSAKTVQGEIIQACKLAFGDVGEVMGSGRTDAGVHALAQVAHIDFKKEISEREMIYGLNDNLPFDVNVISSIKTVDKFHARYSALKRSYVYQISRTRSAFGKSHLWWIKDTLNLGTMRRAGSLCVGMHDFSSFAELDRTNKDATKVLVDSLDIIEYGDLILLRIRASHFLWKMVRRLTGALVEVGRGNLTENEFANALNFNTEYQLKFTAPPSGLFLEQVLYPGDTFIKELHPPIASLNLTNF